MRWIPAYSILFFLITILLPLSTFASASQFGGQVVNVIDGDTIEILDDGKIKRINIYGIDCPEEGQPYGAKAKDFVIELVFEKSVVALIRGRDKDGKTVGEILLREQVDGNLGSILVKNGLAWWDRTNASYDRGFEQDENTARINKIGLWSQFLPAMPPWDFREGGRRKLLWFWITANLEIATLIVTFVGGILSWPLIKLVGFLYVSISTKGREHEMLSKYSVRYRMPAMANNIRTLKNFVSDILNERKTMNSDFDKQINDARRDVKYYFQDVWDAYKNDFIGKKVAKRLLTKSRGKVFINYVEPLEYWVSESEDINSYEDEKDIFLEISKFTRAPRETKIWREILDEQLKEKSIHSKSS